MLFSKIVYELLLKEDPENAEQYYVQNHIRNIEISKDEKRFLHALVIRYISLYTFEHALAKVKYCPVASKNTLGYFVASEHTNDIKRQNACAFEIIKYLKTLENKKIILLARITSEEIFWPPFKSMCNNACLRFAVKDEAEFQELVDKANDTLKDYVRPARIEDSFKLAELK
jgi:hypothetical protein